MGQAGQLVWWIPRKGSPRGSFNPSPATQGHWGRRANAQVEGCLEFSFPRIFSPPSVLSPFPPPQFTSRMEKGPSWFGSVNRALV